MGWFYFFGIYQVIIYRYIFGALKGNFEYAHREAIIEKTIRRVIITKYGFFIFIRYLSDQFSQIRTFNEDFLVKLSHETNRLENDIEFAIYIKLAELSRKNLDYEKERIYLEKALENKPMNLIAHFKLAVALEGAGLGDCAIKHYEFALQDPNGISDQLTRFITMQVLLVKKQGPRKKPPMPGLRFLTY